MNNNVILERDLLYMTERIEDPGSVNVKLYNPGSAKLPVLITENSGHNPVLYIYSLVDLIQKELFERVKLDIKKNIDLFIKCDDVLKAEYGTDYLKAEFISGKITFKGITKLP